MGRVRTESEKNETRDGCHRTEERGEDSGLETVPGRVRGRGDTQGGKGEEGVSRRGLIIKKTCVQVYLIREIPGKSRLTVSGTHVSELDEVYL